MGWPCAYIRQGATDEDRRRCDCRDCRPGGWRWTRAEQAAHEARLPLSIALLGLVRVGRP